MARSDRSTTGQTGRKEHGEKPNGATSNGATLGFETKLWQAADRMRNNMDAAEYKHVVFGLIFLKHISGAFEVKRAVLEADMKSGADAEDPDEDCADNIFWVPKVARWPHLQGKAKQPTIGKLVEEAMIAIERDNPILKGVLPKDFARPALDKQRLGELIDLIGTIGLGDRQNRSRDVLGHLKDLSPAETTLSKMETARPAVGRELGMSATRPTTRRDRVGQVGAPEGEGE